MDSHAAAAALPPNETDSTATIHFKEVDEEDDQDFDTIFAADLTPPTVCVWARTDRRQ